MAGAAVHSRSHAHKQRKTRGKHVQAVHRAHKQRVLPRQFCGLGMEVEELLGRTEHGRRYDL